MVNLPLKKCAFFQKFLLTFMSEIRYSPLKGIKELLIDSNLPPFCIFSTDRNRHSPLLNLLSYVLGWEPGMFKNRFTTADMAKSLMWLLFKELFN